MRKYGVGCALYVLEGSSLVVARVVVLHMTVNLFSLVKSSTECGVTGQRWEVFSIIYEHIDNNSNKIIPDVQGSRMVRELFVMAREAAPSIIFMDEIDSIGSSRQEGSEGGDSEVQRTMLELLNQLDGFEPTQNIKVSACLCAHGIRK